jgi:glutamate synthase domain-containing protein 2
MMITLIVIVILLLLISMLLLVPLFGWRWLTKRFVKKMGEILFTDSYQENLMELIPGFKHMGIQHALENNLRAETGDILHRPLGNARIWPHMESLMFIPDQLRNFPTAAETEVDMKVIIGPKARKPLELDIPLLIGAMAYGLALSEQSRMALAEAAKQTNTAINTGEGVVLPEELGVGGKLILQFSKTDWAKDENLYKQADMIEIKFGQGAMMGMGTKINPENLTGRARELMGLGEEEAAQIYEHFFNQQTQEDLKGLVKELRQASGGVPIGAKIAAGGRLEEDIDVLLSLDVDFIAIDGGQAATHGAPAILSDSFGIPTLHAVIRASNYLEKQKMKGKVSLLVSGGLFTPGDFLKTLALGADAVYLGSALLFAVAHSQTLKALPFEPPTQVVWHEGKFANQLDKEKGAETAVNFIHSCVEEMKVGIRAMGKHALKEISKQDLVSHDQQVAKMCDVPCSSEPWNKKIEEEDTGAPSSKDEQIQSMH